MKNKLIWVVIGLGAFLRFIPESRLMLFTADEAYLSYLAQTIIDDFHIIWIGWSALGFDLYLGPFWVYFISPFLALSKGDPLILGYLANLLGVATIYIIYWLGVKVFSKRVGFIASLLYACSPLIVFYEQKPYPPAVPLLSMLMLISLYLSQKKKYWWFVFAGLYGLVFHIHLSLVPVIFVAICLFFTDKKNFNKNTVSGSIIIFLLTISPLVVFDYFHKGSNISAPIRALQMSKGQAREAFLNKHADALFNSLGRVWYLKAGNESVYEITPNCLTVVNGITKAPIIFSFLGTIVLFMFLFNKTNWKNKAKRLLAIYSLAFILPFLFVSVINPVEYYLLGFYPLLLLMFGLQIEQSKGIARNIAYLLVVLLVSLGILTISSARDNFGLRSKKILINKTLEFTGDESFSLSSTGGCQSVGGWRYLFKVYGRAPNKSSDDLTFGWLYPTELSDAPTKYGVVISESEARDKIQPGFTKEVTSGGFSGFIYENY